MAQGLLGGVLPAIYSGADQLKRGVYGLLTNPQEQAQRAAQSLLQSRAERQALMGQAFANPDRPFQVTNPQALSQLGTDVLTGELGIAPVGMIAYHGSPALFNKFDISKVGTGEGNQAFGHGMYFAENPNIAKSYQSSLGRWIDRIKIGDKELPIYDAMSKYADEGETAAKVLQRMKDKGQITIDQYNNIVKDVVIPEIRTNAKIPQEKWGDVEGVAGNLYKVDIPDEKIPTMMDWDKTLGEQSDAVKKAINNLKKQVTQEMKDELGGDLNLLFGKDITPSQFLNTWEIIHPTGGVGIGERLLNEQGVKGIRYLDNVSRDAGKGTSNFVVFDPTDVKILERNDKPVEGLLD